MSEPYQIPMLPVEPRDLALGRYMDAWSRMEGFARLIFRDLLGTDWDVAAAVFASMGTKQMKDVLTAIGAILLTDVGAKRLESLCERMGKQNTKRNNIVHGSWILNVIADELPDGRRQFTTTWVRAYTPVQYEYAKKTARYDLPKVGEHYAFTIPQLATATKHVEALMGDLSTFFGEIASLRRPEPQPDEAPS